jgi:hypothetical protein
MLRVRGRLHGRRRDPRRRPVGGPPAKPDARDGEIVAAGSPATRRRSRPSPAGTRARVVPANERLSPMAFEPGEVEISGGSSRAAPALTIADASAGSSGAAGAAGRERGVGGDDRSPLDALLARAGPASVAGPEVGGGDAARRERATSVQRPASPATGWPVAARARTAWSGWLRPGGPERDGRAARRRRTSASAGAWRPPATGPAPLRRNPRSGAKRWIHDRS